LYFKRAPTINSPNVTPFIKLGAMKLKTLYRCQQCGATHSKWMGRCSGCQEWNSIVEEQASAKEKTSRGAPSLTSTDPLPIMDLVRETFPRWPTDLSELDTVLGGGLVPGSVVLLGGEPGVGKSTLLLQAADQYAKLGKKVLYVSGEESTSQIAMRAERLGVRSSEILVMSETKLESVFAQIERLKPDLMILDSIQTVYSQQLESQPGSIGQLRECAFEIIQWSKSRNMATFLVGHVTKDGAIAGPKVLEHMVDVVLYFEGMAAQGFRLLRSIKNRFGSTNELGVFEIQTAGLRPVSNPSELFLAERSTQIPGSVVVASLEGNRPLLLEVQALVAGTYLNIPRRTAIGIDSNRVSLLVAILEKRGGLRLHDQDIYVNVAGGLRITETAIDLGVTAAMLSSFSGRPIDSQSVFFGEVGLGGEVRAVPQTAERIKEAKRIGLKRAYLPEKSAKGLKGLSDFELLPVAHVQELAGKI
jgi:DNA repair protein RadA/Sms